ncbi:TldD/PmbA family protein [Bacteriovoracales bacterium]|nr:TldD/PmbA family protein [Bacteriovoracales bacterium]
MDNQKQNVQMLEKVLDMAKSKGAKDSEVLFTQSSKFSLKANEGSLEEYKVSSSQIMGIRLTKDQKVGISYCEDMQEESLSLMVEQALENSRYVKEDEFEEICVSHKDRVFSDNEKTYREDNTPAEKKIELCLALEKGVKDKDSSVKGAPYNGYNEGESHSYIANSLGTLCFEKDKSFSCYTSALLEKEGKQSMHYHGSVGRNFKDLDLNNCIDESFNHAHALLTAGPIETGKYDVIFSLDMLDDIFGVFSTMFSGKSAVDGVNPYREKIGQKVAVSGLSIKDCPQYIDGFNYSTFDDEGNLRKEFSLIENGVLKTFYHNSATAKFHNVENNSCASRSPKGTLGVGGTQQIISHGESSETDLKKGRYLNIVSLQGLHSGADALSGDFSFGASGYLCENGIVGKGIKGITISGNFYQLLQEISLIGKDMKSNAYSTFFSPEIRFSNLNIAGK